MSSLRVPIHRLDPGLPVPAYAHPGDAGADLHSRVDVQIAPFERVLVPTGLALAVPEGYVGLVHPRSGLAHRIGLTILNAPGTIDAGYRGEVMVNLINLDPRTPITLNRGDRIAQLVIQSVESATFVPGDLDSSERGAGGHGSTGVSVPPGAADGVPGTIGQEQSVQMSVTSQGAPDVQP